MVGCLVALLVLLLCLTFGCYLLCCGCCLLWWVGLFICGWVVSLLDLVGYCGLVLDVINLMLVVASV